MFLFQGYNGLANGVLTTVSYRPSSGGKVIITFHLIIPNFLHIHIKLLLLGIHSTFSCREPQQQLVFNEVIFCTV